MSSTKSMESRNNWETIASGNLTPSGGIFFNFKGTFAIWLGRMGLPTSVSMFQETNKDGGVYYILRWVTATYEVEAKSGKGANGGIDTSQFNAPTKDEETASV